MHVHVHVLCLCVGMCMRLYVRTRVHMHVCVRVCTFVCMYACTRVHIHMYVCAHVWYQHLTSQIRNQNKPIGCQSSSMYIGNDLEPMSSCDESCRSSLVPSVISEI
jgi:hypothetical protein